MDRFSYQRSSSFPRVAWVATLEQVAKNAGLDYTPVPLVGSWTGSELLVVVRHLGGSLTPVEPFYGWTLARPIETLTAAVAKHAPEFTVGSTTAHDFLGAAILELSGQRYVVLRTDHQAAPERVERRLILGAPSLQEALTVADRLSQTAKSLFTRGHVQVFGSIGSVAHDPVAEDDVILPADMKADLLGYLDRFWEAADLCAKLKISPSRGVLLVGPPGTGKSLLVRHLLTRYAETRQFMFVGNASDQRGDILFSALLEQLNGSKEPALVVLEDVDYLVEERRVSMDLLLNALDGLLRPRCPVLWLATTNDPAPLAQNLLDRPGRFDRVVMIEHPAETEREALFRRYSPFVVDETRLCWLVERSAGLAATHIREACYSAALAAADDPEAYGARLEEAARRVAAAQHTRVGVKAGRSSKQIGFGSSNHGLTCHN